MKWWTRRWILWSRPKLGREPPLAPAEEPTFLEVAVEPRREPGKNQIIPDAEAAIAPKLSVSIT